MTAQAQVLRNRTVDLVVGDTGRLLRAWLYDPIARDASGNRLPVDLSAAGTLVVFRFRVVGGTTIKATLTCTKLAGIVNRDGEIDTAAPYSAAGSGGLVQVDWTSPSLDTAGKYVGEFFVTFESGKTLTVNNVINLSIRNKL